MPVIAQEYPKMANMGCYLMFNENTGTTVKDYSGNGHNFTLSNALAWDTGTNMGVSCMDCGESYSAIYATGGSSDFQIGAAESKTIEMWIRQVSDTNTGRLCEWYSASPTKLMTMFVNATKLSCRLIDGVAFDSTDIESTTAITLNAWNHIAFVVDRTAGFAYMYINGVQDATTINIGACGAVLPVDNCGVGSQGSGATIYKGKISQFAIWGYAKHDFGYARSGINL